MTTLSESARTYNMDEANRRLERAAHDRLTRLTSANEALDLIGRRVHKVFQDTTCPSWVDMHTTLRGILKIVDTLAEQGGAS